MNPTAPEPTAPEPTTTIRPAALTLELLHRTALREYAAVHGSVLGALVVVLVLWGNTPAWLLALFAVIRLGGLVHNHRLASRLLAVQRPEDLGTLPRQMLLGLALGGAGWGAIYWLVPGRPSGDEGEFIALALPLFATPLMLITAAHWRAGMWVFIGSMWLVAGARLVLDAEWRNAPLFSGLMVMLVVTALFGRQLLKQTRDGVVAELLNCQLARELSAANARLSLVLAQTTELATRDPLTGLMNRRAMLERLDLESERLRRGAAPATILLVDLDHFKRINDQHGHGVGDQILVASAHGLASRLRKVDLLARWGGEEFLVVLPETDAASGRAVGEQLCAAVAALASPEWPPGLRVTASMGLARWSAPEPLQEAIHRADLALYSAKGQGRNRVVLSGEAATDTVPA